jgi:hypothetical protein
MLLRTTSFNSETSYKNTNRRPGNGSEKNPEIVFISLRLTEKKEEENFNQKIKKRGMKEFL